MLFYSQLQNLKILDSRGQKLAFLRDLALKTDATLPRVSGIVAKRLPNQRWLIPWEKIERLDYDRVILRENVSLQEFQAPTERDRLLTQDVLDSQVVDVNGAKVVRVNDVQLASLQGQLLVIGVDIGPWGLARRLGFAEGLSMVAHAFRIRVPEGLVPWDVVETLQKTTEVQLKVSQDRLTRMHPADLADIYADLGYEQRTQLLSELDDSQVADVLEEMEPDEAAEVLEELGNERAADVLEEMEPDEAADVLGELSEHRAEELIGLMEAEEADEVRELLAHEEDTVGALMNTGFFALAARVTVAQALADLKSQEEEIEVFDYVYLIDEAERLEGVVSLRDMLLAPPELTLGELSPTNVYHVSVDDDHDEPLRLLMKYGLQAIPVVEKDDRLAGVVTLHDAIYPLVPEHLR